LNTYLRQYHPFPFIFANYDFTGSDMRSPAQIHSSRKLLQRGLNPGELIMDLTPEGWGKWTELLSADSNVAAKGLSPTRQAEDKISPY
jgi:predicted methyltransferase